MSATQVDLDWAGAGPLPANGANDVGSGSGNGAGVQDAAYLTDEEILGLDPPSPNGGYGGRSGQASGTAARGRDDISSGDVTAQDAGLAGGADGAAAATREAAADAAMPAWMAALAGDPKVKAEAEQLWSEHQAFRAAFHSADEARAVAEDARALKEIFPGGMQEARALKQGTESLREAAQSIDRIDAAIFSGDVRAQSEVVAELARANPAAFRSLVAEATKVLATLPGSAPVVNGHFSRMVGPPSSKGGFGGLAPELNIGVRGAENGTGDTDQRVRATSHGSLTTNHGSLATSQGSLATNHGSSVTNQGSLATSQESLANHGAPGTNLAGAAFDPVAYASFERATNEVVARDVRGSIGDTLTRVLPEGVADGAAKRIGEDIFSEIHRALAADRTLSEQVGDALRDRRFGSAEQQRVASLIAGRAKQMVPSVARRVISEWTSSVLGTARSKAARQAAAASRVDIAAPGGSLDSMPLRALSSREVNYASMSDDEILAM